MDYYAHTISKSYDYSFSDIKKLEIILKTGYLLSRRKLNLCEKEAAYNGMDYISLCDLGQEHNEYSAYFMYTMNGLSLLFDRKIKVIKPIIVEMDPFSVLNEVDKMHRLGMKKTRYSDLHDEVQVKDEISLLDMQGVSVSLNNLNYFHNREYVKDYLEAIKKMLISYKYNVPIYNLDNEKIIEVKKI